jgi:hypothetical protein
MDVLWRRIAIGTIAGALASAVLVATVGPPFFSVPFGIVIGGAYSASLRPTRGAYVDNLMAAAAMGVPLWVLVISFPLFSGQMPEWSAEQSRQHFPALVGDAWEYLPPDQARSKAYRWNEDGIAGICDRHQYLCFSPALWNGSDPILKERLLGLSSKESNHGEDVKGVLLLPRQHADALLYEVPLQVHSPALHCRTHSSVLTRRPPAPLQSYTRTKINLEKEFHLACNFPDPALSNGRNQTVSRRLPAVSPKSSESAFTKGTLP